MASAFNVSLWILLACCLLFQMSTCWPRLRHSARGMLCSKCAPGWGVTSPCSPQRDTTCAPCAPGSYAPHHSYHAPCWGCSRCGDGLFEARPCSPRTDTVCDSCHRPGSRHTADFRRKCLGVT